jgi:hypothetical protein
MSFTIYVTRDFDQLSGSRQTSSRATTGRNTWEGTSGPGHRKLP